MLNRLSTWLAVSPLAIALTTVASPVYARPPLQHLQATLQRTVCLSDWDGAIATLGQMLGSSELSPEYRERLLHTRRQFAEHRARNLTMNWESHPACAAAIAAIPASSTTGPQALNPERPLNWERAVAAVAILNGREAASGATPPVAAASPWAASASPAALPRVERPHDACQPELNGDRRVASGAVSNRWRYEILESRSRLFYVRYWNQTDCEFIYQTNRHETQNAAYEEFMARIGATDHRPAVRSRPRSQEREIVPQRQRTTITGENSSLR
ncbi:MAG TPA: hypothetical protein IGS37_07180 [Synechococcales cyanobacterium M55_K2018_004]|nr:hypothetical protein [Synechococcales cyanobacterium M55_K2018_004]